MKRIEFLDGLRGLAIILVVLYHSYFRWSPKVPYGSLYSDYFFIQYGYLGVQLFFLISGFVILMSLEKSDNFFSFLYKRWLRLFPAMLIATVLIFITASFLYERPAGKPELDSIIPGLLFISPNWIESITGIYIEPIEGVFWSLYVEVVFYLIFGIFYFIAGRKKAIMVIFLMYVLSVIGKKLHIDFLNVLSNWLFFKYFCWFASGSLAYLYFIDKKRIYLFFSILVSLLEVYKYRYDSELLLFYIFILSAFFLPIIFEKTRFLFNNRVLLFCGIISYPFYLIHENAMIALICKEAKIIDIPYVFLPLIPVIILMFVSYLIMKILEPFIRNLIIKSNIKTKEYLLIRR